jgi:hypothetical protein
VRSLDHVLLEAALGDVHGDPTVALEESISTP